jgi:beta-glucosidase
MVRDIGGGRAENKGARRRDTALVLALLFLAAAGPEDRARELTAQLSPEEKLALLHGGIALFPGRPAGAIGTIGFVPGVARLGIPALQESDGGLGITNPLGMRPGDTAVALPSGMATAATFNPDVAARNGAVLGREAAARGFNVVLGGGVNLAREPRGGRIFEYAGEDPLLAGTIVGATIRGTQDQHVVSTVKHFAMDDQESARMIYSADMDPAALRESDLLAFEIAIETGHPGAVMCAYNKVNGIYACQNPDLLLHVLKQDWAYPGWVMSDWGAVHDVGAIVAGLDQESGEQLDPQVFFGAPLRAALQQGQVPQARVDDAVRRILTSMARVGLLDHPVKPIVDSAADIEAARLAEDEAIVLLRNDGGILPLRKTVRLAVIGGNADAGVPAGGGSSLVAPVGGFARTIPLGGTGQGSEFRIASFDPPAPLRRLQGRLAGHPVIPFVDGRYPEQAAGVARAADVAIVFATNWSGENSDVPDLSLPEGQDALIERVAAANPRTIVVLETAGPVLMPWRDHVAGIVEAWYPGQGGADAIADVLFGDVNPSGHLPVTFPRREADMPNPVVANFDTPAGTLRPVTYPEGAEAGYRWFARGGGMPLGEIYPFGFGLSYTHFSADHLRLQGGDALTIDFDITNTGTLPGMAVPQAYLIGRGARPIRRLLGWRKPNLRPGETQHVQLRADMRLLADFVTATDRWHVPPGPVSVGVGFDAATPVLTGQTLLTEQSLAP